MTFLSLQSAPPNALLSPLSWFFPSHQWFCGNCCPDLWDVCSAAHGTPIWGSVHSTASSPYLLVGWDGRQSASVSPHPHPIICVRPHSSLCTPWPLSSLHGIVRWECQMIWRHVSILIWSHQASLPVPTDTNVEAWFFPRMDYGRHFSRHSAVPRVRREQPCPVDSSAPVFKQARVFPSFGGLGQSRW